MDKTSCFDGLIILTYQESSAFLSYKVKSGGNVLSDSRITQNRKNRNDFSKKKIERKLKRKLEVHRMIYGKKLKFSPR